MADNAGNATGGQAAGSGAGASGTGGAASGGNGGQGNAPSWLDGLSPDIKGFVELKGFKDPGAIAESYRNLEKLHGVPKERLLKLPEKMDDEAGMAEVFNRLGRPEKPEGYELKPLEQQNKDLAAWLRKEAHGLGLTKTQAEKFAAAWVKQASEALAAETKASETAAAESLQQQQAKLKEEWGAAFDQNSKQVADMKRALGMDEETSKLFDQALGVDVAAKFLHSIITKFGVQLGEDSFRGEGGGSNGFGILSPAAAAAKLDQLKGDQEWIQKWMNGSAEHREEFDRLTRWANGHA